MTETSFYMPTKPYGIIACINRIACATGSPRMAMAGHFADYNGHAINLCWNEYRGYYVAEYSWAGRNVVARSADFLVALRAAKDEYRRQGLGAQISVRPNTEADAALARADDDMTEGKEDWSSVTWFTWKHKTAATALRSHTDHLLIIARDIAEYEALGGYVYSGDGGSKSSPAYEPTVWAERYRAIREEIAAGKRPAVIE